MEVFSVYDSKAEAYLQPFFAQTRGVAIRQFEAAANSVEHNFYRFGADFTLFHIGQWDEHDGTLVMFEVKDSLGTALQFQRHEETE